MTQSTEQFEAANQQPQPAPRITLCSKAALYFAGVGCALVIAGAAVTWASVKTGSLGAGIASLQGKSIYVSARGPVIVDASAAVLSGSVTIELCNLSDAPLRVVGYNNPCACFSLGNLPIELAPHERKDAVVSAAGSKLSADQLTIVFLTDCKSQPEIPVQLTVQRSASVPAQIQSGAGALVGSTK